MRVYYNDNEPFVCQWLRNLIAAGHLPPGDVDERSITEVQPDDVRGYDQCHFFAGIGGWAYAIKLAGWTGPLWTGSCPCQPFSAAGKQKAHEDKRHLWPDFFRLIKQCKPQRIVGEQVAGAIGLYWLDGVCTDLEAEAYTVGSVVLGAHSVGAPHIRQRLYWMAESQHAKRGPFSVAGEDERNGQNAGQSKAHGQFGARREVHGVAHAKDLERHRQERDNAGGCGESECYGGLGNSQHDGPFTIRELVREEEERRLLQSQGSGCGMGNANGAGCGELRGTESIPTQQRPAERPSNPWADAVWLPCGDGKARRIGTDTIGLVDGFPSFLASLRPDHYTQAVKEVINYGQATTTRYSKVLRAVWGFVRTDAATEREARKPNGLQPAEVLLPYLRALQAHCGSPDEVASGAEVSRGEVRGMWDIGTPTHSPSQRGSGQCEPREPTDAMRLLSRVLARHAGAAWIAHSRQNAQPIQPLVAGESGRVGKLRALGNAIVPQVAAEFLMAYMEISGLRPQKSE